MANKAQSAGRLDRPHALWCVEQALQSANLDLDFYLVGQAHYGQAGFAFIDVYGIDAQTTRHRIRKEAGERLERLGFPVELIDTKDVFHVTAVQPDEGEA